MKHYIYYIITLFFATFSYGQQKTITIDWINSANQNSSESLFTIPRASNIDAELTEDGELLFSTSWEYTGASHVGGKIVNATYEVISGSLLKNISKKNISESIKYSITSSGARGIIYENIVFCPIVKQNGVFKRITSFKISSTLKTTQISSKALQSTKEVSSSVLASGLWYKFKIDATGIYRITPQFLQSIGVDLNGVDANTIKIYGNGGKPLPLRNSDNLIFDLPENPIKIIGAEDGVFSGADQIFFYGRGTLGYEPENKTNINPFSDEAYYYVTTGGASSKRVETLLEPSGAVSSQFNTYDYSAFVEKDEVNIGGIGRVWHGDEFDFVTKREYDFFVPDIEVGSSVNVEVKFSAVFSSQPTLVTQVKVGASVLAEDSVLFNNFGQNAYSNTVRIINATGFSGNNLKVNLDYIKGIDPSSIGYLDYIIINSKSQLRDYGKQFTFSNSATALESGIGQFNLQNATNVSAIWDVTNPYAISEKTNNTGSQVNIKFPLGSERKFVSINRNDLYSPIAIQNSKVSNQDLKGQIFKDANGQFEDIDYLIVTNTKFVGAANRLANFRKLNDGFNVKIVTVDKIYEEFSSGKQDISAIRNFVKYIYDNASSEEERIKYVCVIGDGSYDYKDRIRNNTNEVPLYHASNSRSFASSYTTDDFYGFMDSNEGVDAGLDRLDIAVGRIVAPTAEQANIQVDKIIRYYDKKAFGTWRNRFLFISDDVDRTNPDSQLQVKVDTLAKRYSKSLKNANIEKIYADAFRQEVSPGGERYPDVNRGILNFFELGVAYVNYFGHGGEDGLAAEFVFTADGARNLRNKDRMPVFITLTCELTRFDNPARVTAGELMFWNANGGAVSLITTTRNLFVTTGLNLNDRLAESLFDENGNAIPTGEALRVAKNRLSGSNKRTVFCVGDPALIIAFPKPKVILTEINDIAIGGATDPIKALDKVKLSGEVVDPVSNNKLLNYAGVINVILFDKDIERQTLANNGQVDANGNLVKLDFLERGATVFNGQATVVNGEFDIEFVLPKNVKLEIGKGKVSFYAQNSSILQDQSGNSEITIGGVNLNAEEDIVPPIINVFLNDENFVSGAEVNSSPTLLAKFFDPSGINTSGGVGHDIVAILDDDEKNPILLNQYYVAELDDFTKGVLSFKLQDLSPGEHSLKLRASDVYNNSITQEVTFRVAQSGDFAISEVLNYPNPFVSYTEFWFKHNGAPDDTLEVTVQVFTVSGKVVMTKSTTVIDANGSGTTSSRGDITWDGRDDFGDKIGKGVYVYKITVKSALTNKTVSKFEKLVIL